MLVVLYPDTVPAPEPAESRSGPEGAAPPGSGGSETAHVLLTRRAAGLRSHAHEVSFPGGHVDAGDADLYGAALREAHEEIGLDPASVREAGMLGRYATFSSATLIHPFVAVCDTVPEVHVASPAEVEAIIAVSLAELLADDAWREEIWPFPPAGEERAVTFFEVPGDTIWGATAAMLRDLLSVATAGIDAAGTAGASADAITVPTARER